MMNTKPTTFTKIFGKKLDNGKTINNIEIPIIQRDYAQGRESKEVSRIRDKFINSLNNALTGTAEDAIKLDFVYGNVEEGKLIPLDGQQRLTTLFLLHWYIAKHESIELEDQLFLKKFTYKTRFSSQHFCDSLVNSNPDFECDTLSEWLMDQNWFMYSWEKDPTIHAMLVMLDKIHTVFKDEENLWGKLTSIENPPISFYFLALEDMGLTDSLYIKMNSRGKPLTEFEHFKADFEKLIKEVSIELYNEFVKKVDVDWVDMLWGYRGVDDIIDDEFMKYHRFITEMICYEQEIEILENDFDLAFEVYGKQNESAKENLRFLFNAFDCWKSIESIDNFFDTTFSKFDFEKNKVCIFSDTTDLFLQCCNYYGLVSGKRRQFTLNNTLIFYGVLQYLLNKEIISEVDFNERIRIVRNLVFNSSDEIRETRMKALLQDTKNIMVNCEISTKTLGYNVIQKNEELDKINWRQDNPSLKKSINQLEDHFILQGNIAIIGLEESEKFKLRANSFISLFNSEIGYAQISNALLTIGDYSQLASWRFLFGNKNDSTWRELFTPSNQRKRFENTKSALWSLLYNINGDIIEYMNNLVVEFINNKEQPMDWRYYFLKYSAMRSGVSGVYYWCNDPSRTKENQYEIIMMNTSLSLNGKHWNPFLYTLHKDSDFNTQTSLEEYNAPLIINQSGNLIRCTNSNWEIYNSNNELLETIEIKQKDNVDIEDRIEVIKNYLQSL